MRREKQEVPPEAPASPRSAAVCGIPPVWTVHDPGRAGLLLVPSVADTNGPSIRIGSR